LFQVIPRVRLPRTVERIDGMFAFAFRDGASGALHLVRDRFGEKPLYWGQARGRLVFRLAGFRAALPPGFCETGIDRQAAYGLLLFEYLPGSASSWSGIEKLELSTILTFADRRISRERY
jgi:asparagine synthase (glutamine-hydrolysing)